MTPPGGVLPLVGMAEAFVCAIYDTLSEYGTSIVCTPRVFEVALQQKVNGTPREFEAIAAAASAGFVDVLLNRPDADAVALAKSLSERAGVPLPAARWSIEIWRTALRHVTTGTPPPRVDWSRLEPTAPAIDRRARIAILALFMVALTGAAAGSGPGLLTAWGLTHDRPQAVRLRALVEKHELPGTRMTPGEFAAWAGTLGGVGGLLGATLGWLSAGARPLTVTRVLAAMIGASWAFDASAFGLAQFGLTGAFMGPLFAGALCVMLACLLGPFAVVMLLKPLAWGVVPHF